MTALRHHGGDGCGGGEAVEKGAPDAVITGVLIDEDAEAAAVLHVFHGTGEAVLPIEECVAEFTAAAYKEGVEKGVPQGLIDGGWFAIKDEEAGDLGEYLPTTEMADEVKDGPLLLHGGMGVLHAFDGDALFDVGLFHHGQFEAAKDVRYE